MVKTNMLATNPYEPPADFADPRLAPDFAPADWPLCNGAPAPPFADADLHHRRCIEFLARFYELNRRTQQLYHARQTGAMAATVAACLAALGDATKVLEALEDRYAAIGFFGEPSMADLHYADIRFTRPQVPRSFPAPVTISSQFAIPGLEDLPPEELVGTPTIVRWTRGKAHS